MKSDAAQLEKQLRTLTQDLFSSKDLDPWVRECRDIYSPGHRDAFIGNGLIGLRVPPEGEPSVYPVFHAVKMAPGGTQMHGLWDDKGMVPTFNFLGLKIQHGRMVFRRDSGAILNYVQKLDWKTATVTTECDWHHWGCVFHIETKIWLSRSNQNLGCVETTITSDRDTGFSVMDIVDGSFIPGSTPMEYKFGTFYMLPKVVSSRFGGHQVAAATTLTIDGNEAPGHVECTPGGYIRQNVIMIKKDTPCRIVKYAAMVSDAASEDPVNTAATLAGYAIENHETMRAEHEKAWAKLWEHNIETDHPGVQMLVNDGLYHLYCNLDEHGKGGVPGPCGLSGNAWANHIFWDAETWSFPPAALMNPGMASNYIKYRVDSLPGARRNAAALGLPGALFPWEGGKSGDELIPGLIYSKQHHINADVILAIWKYYLVTGDETYLKEQAAELIFACADFWAERAVYNEEKDRYEILKVCCPDEGARIQNNNAFTNYGAKFSLELAEKVVAACEKESNFAPIYADELSIQEKIETIAREIYGADGVDFEPAALRSLRDIEAMDPAYSRFPVCMAKTQYSLSDDAAKLGRPSGFRIHVREVKLSAGAGFVVVLTGAIMTMPGLPKSPAAYRIDVDDAGIITGLF